MLAIVQKHCPETRDWTRWPVFWAFVDPGSSQETVYFTIQHPKETAAGAAGSRHTGAPAA